MSLDDIAREVCDALRALMHNRAFAAVAVPTLAIGIAANTAIFSVVDAILCGLLHLRSVAYRASTW